MSARKSKTSKSNSKDDEPTEPEVEWVDFRDITDNSSESQSKDTSPKKSPTKQEEEKPSEPKMSAADPIKDVTKKTCRTCKEVYPQHQDWFAKHGLSSKGTQKFAPDCRVCVVKAQNATRAKEGQPEKPLPILGEPRKKVSLQVPEPVPKKQLPASNTNPWSKPKGVPQPNPDKPTPDMILNPKPESIPEPTSQTSKVEVDKDGRTLVTLKKEHEPKPDTKIIAPKPAKGTMEDIFPDENVKYIEPADPDDEIDYEFLRSELYKLEVVYHPTAKLMNITPQSISEAGPDELLMMHDRLKSVSQLGSTANLLYHGLLGVAGILEQTMITSEKVTNQIDAHGYKDALRDDENTLALVREFALEYEEEFAEFVGIEYRLGFHSLTTLLETSYKNKNPEKLKDGQNGKTITATSRPAASSR